MFSFKIAFTEKGRDQTIRKFLSTKAVKLVKRAAKVLKPFNGQKKLLIHLA